MLRLGDTHVGVTPMGDRTRLVGMVELDGTPEGLNAGRIDVMKSKAAPYLSGSTGAPARTSRSDPAP